MLHRRVLLASLVWLLAAPALAQQSLLRIPIVLHAIALTQSTSQAFVGEQLAHANEIFVPLGVELVLERSNVLPLRHAELDTRADRDALARYVRRGAVHWFVVNKLMDVDEPGRERRGVHWRERGAARRHYVVVSKISGPYVLAHELGHYFGNPVHSEVAGNLMSYERAEGAPFLDARQIANVHAALARMLATKELTRLGKAASTHRDGGAARGE